MENPTFLKLALVSYSYYKIIYDLIHQLTFKLKNVRSAHNMYLHVRTQFG